MSLLQIYFIIICLGLNLIKNINGHLHPAYNHDTNGLGSNPDWQSKLDDNIKINHLSLPGTHDTMADDNDNDSVDTQDSSLPKQLEAGIRVLDIRARAYNGEFPIHHGAFYLNAKFDDVLNECKEFLDAHPREFIIMNVQQEYSEVSADDFGKIFATYFNNKKWSSYFYRSDDYDIIPSVGDVRGKIYILQYWGYEQKIEKFGFNMGANDINNDYWLDTNWDLYEKWEGIKSYLIKANNNPKPSKFIINYLSANGGSWPYFVASGHSSIGTGAPRLSTGLTTPGWSDSYPDFPRVDCFIGICTIAFEGTNILTYEYIKNNALTFVGIIYADFPGQGLIDLIIPLNYIKYRITSSEGYWGTWSLPRYCKPGEFANAFSLKVEGPQGEDGDDTAANSFRMKCSDGDELIANNEGEWGGWSGYQTCSGGQHFKGFRTFVEPAQGDGDDTALNSLQIQCGDQQILSASNGGIWGNWGSWGLCANDDRVCGFQQKVEPGQGGGDDTSLNGIRLWCCRQNPSEIHSTTYFKGPNPVNYDNAVAYCQSRGSKLASIETESDWNEAKAVCGPSRCLIGLRDVTTEGQWSWDDGMDITTSYGFNSDRTAKTGEIPWNAGEPNNDGGDEDCVEINGEANSDGKYNDVPCNLNRYYPLCNGL